MVKALGIEGYDFNNIPDVQMEWLWQDYLAKGSMTVLAAAPKVGKSTLLFHLLQKMRLHETFLDRPTNLNGDKILLFTEESAYLLKQRKEELGDLPVHCVGLQPGLSWIKMVAYIKYMARQEHKLVIIDTISRFWPVQNEGDAVQVLQALTPLLTVARTEDVALLLIHHTRKTGGSEGNAMRGSNALLGSADIGIELGRITPWDKTNRRRLEALSRYSTPDTLTMEKVGTEYVVSAEGNIEKQVMEYVSFEGSITAEGFAEETGKSLRTAQKILSELSARGVLDRTGSGGPRSPFIFTIASTRKD